LILLAGKNVTA